MTPSLIRSLPFILLTAAALPAHAAAPAVIEADPDPSFDVKAVVNPASAPAVVYLGLGPQRRCLGVRFSREAVVLARYQGEKSTPLDVVKVRPEDKFPVVVQWRDGEVRVIRDSRVLIRRAGLGGLQGTIATEGEWTDAKVQPVENVHFSDDFMRTGAVPDDWTPVKGFWKLNTSGDPNLGANSFSYIGQGTSAIAITGRWFWSDYKTSVSARPSGDGAMGIIADWQDDKNFFVAKWYSEADPTAANRKKQLWRVLNGKAELVAAAPGGFVPDQWYRLALSAAHGKLSFAVDGETVLEKGTDLFGQGKSGLFREGASHTMFDDVDVVPADEIPAPPVDQVAAGPARFAKDASMEDWSSPKGQWLPAEKAPGVFWNRGTFFGDYGVAVDAKYVTTTGSKIRVLGAGDGISADSGYAFQVTSTPDTRFVQGQLLRAGQLVAGPARKLIEGDGRCQIKLQRRGNIVLGLINNNEVVRYTDASPLQGRRVGYSCGEAQVAPADASVIGGNVIDYTFYNAPTDWIVTSGTWDCASRWICTPTWTWFAGWSDRLAAIWNKRSFDGDFAIEVFAASKMDLASKPYYAHPRDLNITIAGDGQDPASGYSCIFGGWNDTYTRILRGTKIVAETDKVLLPTSATYHAVAHHKWFCLRVEKTGDTISYYVDRKLALQYKDPNPLQGKRIALWTAGNGIMVARATIYYQNQKMDLPAVTRLAQAAAPKVTTDKLNWQTRVVDPGLTLSAIPGETGAPAVQLTNSSGGGTFSMRPQLEPFDVAKTPKLSFGCKFSPGTEINLYVLAKGAVHSFRLSGPDKDNDFAGATSLGSALTPSDGKWHEINVDLAALLAKIYPAEKDIQIDEIYFANCSKDSYAQAGFGSNTAGSTYAISGFTLRAPDNRIARVIEPVVAKPGAGG